MNLRAMFADVWDFLRRSVENPSTPLSAGADWMYDVFGAIKSASGVRVNRKTVFTYSPFWRGVNLIAKDVAKLPLVTNKIGANGQGKQKDVRHPAYRLLRRKPNSEQTAYAFKLLVQSHAIVEGNGYAYIMRRGDASPAELIPLLPDRTYPVRHNGVLWYVTTVNGEMRKLKPEDVIHIKGIGFDGLAGYPLYQFARDSLGIGMAAMKYGAKYFANNAEPSFVLEYPGVMGEEEVETLSKSWDRMHGGLEMSHRPALLEQGVTLKPVGSNAKQAQLLETRQFEAKEVANWLSIPVHKLGVNDNASYNSLEQENQAYLDDGLEGWLVNWEEEAYEKLLTEEEKAKETHSVDFDRLALVRAQLAARGAYYTQALTAGWMNVDEVRDREGMPAAPDGKGQIFRQPLNMTEAGAEPDGDEGEPADPPPATKEPAEPKKPKPKKQQKKRRLAALAAAHRALIVDAVARMVRRIATHARKAAKRPERFLDWLDADLREQNRDVLVDVFTPIAAAAAAISGQQRFDGPKLADSLLDTLRTDLLEASGRASADQLDRALDEVLRAREMQLPDQTAEALLAA